MTPMRLLDDGAADGTWNMAVDEALWRSADDRSWPVLRLYSWRPATLSLGYFQSADDRMLHPPSANLAWVRRATGGGAIVHDREITYSLIWPRCGADSMTALEMYDRVHHAWRRALLTLGVDMVLCEGGRAGDSKRPPYLCFLRRGVGDGMVGGHKVLGSAQRRSRSALLQHGSLLWRRSQWAPELPGLADLMGWVDDAERLRRQGVAELARALGCHLVDSELSEIEREMADRIRRQRYADRAWNQRR